MKRRARRRAMTAVPVSFGKLKADLPVWAKKVDDLPKTPAAQSNAVSALNGLMASLGLTDEHLVGELLRGDFYPVRDEHLRALKEGRSRRYLRARKYLLQCWHVLMRAIDHDQSVVDGYMTPLQRALGALFINERKITPTARRVGMAPQTLSRWLTGALPRFGTEHHLRALEGECELPPGALMDLLPYNPVRRGRDPALLVEKAPYRNLLSEQQKDPYRLRACDALPLLRTRWRALMAYKSAFIEGSSAAQAHDSLAAVMAEVDRAEAGDEEDSEKIWRLDARSALDPPFDEDKRWFDVIGGFECPTANIPFSYLLSMAGWAGRTIEKGGAGLPKDEVQRRGLGLFTDIPLALAFFKWRVARSVKVNGYAIGFLEFISMLCNPDTGYLLTHEGALGIGADNGFAKKEWLARCKAAWKWANSYAKRMKPLKKKSNDPAVTLKKCLREAMPLNNFMIGLERLEGRRPPTDDLMEAIWARDTLLLAILMSNPLRAKNLKRLTYLPDNSGQLYRSTAGAWKIRLAGFHFKNFKGAARHKDYDQEVNPAFWPIIDRYLRSYRKTLGDVRPELVFVGSNNSPKVWDGLGQRVAYLTERYVPGCEGGGVRPHAFRHIVCSSLVIKTQNFILAADTLHDLPQTVATHYSHLLASQGNRGRAEVLGSVYSKYTATTERRRPSAAVGTA